jgi:hypothetical protein
MSLAPQSPGPEPVDSETTARGKAATAQVHHSLPVRGPAPGTVFTWAMLGLLGLGAIAVYVLANATNARASDYLIFAILGIVTGPPLTLVALILAIVRAIRNHQWRWLAALVLGTVVLPLLPDTLVNAAVYSIAPDNLLPGPSNPLVEWLFASAIALGLVIVPLLVATYAWTNSGRNRMGTSSRVAS